MAVFDGSRVLSGAGTIYVAPLGSVEPTSVTGAWGAGWVKVGYTQSGSTFNTKPKFQAIEVEEELYEIRQAATGAEADLTFDLAETTAQNLIIVLNGGVGSSALSAVSGTNADGSIWVEPPDLGTEVRLMVGWDLLPKGATTSAGSGITTTRLIVRQCLNTAGVKRAAQKGNKYAVYSATMTAEKPATLPPYRFILPASLTS